MRQILITVEEDGGLKIKMDELTPFDAVAVLEIAKYSLMTNKPTEVNSDEV